MPSFAPAKAAPRRSPRRTAVVQPWQRLALLWRGREIKLRAYLDVYMTMLP